MTPQNRQSSEAESRQADAVRSEQQIRELQKRERVASLNGGSHAGESTSQKLAASERRALSKRTNATTLSRQDVPPPVVPLYQLEKYPVKPSLELKKKRLRARQASQEKQSIIISRASRLGSRAKGAAIAVRKTVATPGDTFRGCMLRSTAVRAPNAVTVSTAAGRHPYQSSHVVRGGRGTLLGSGRRNHHTSSQELVRVRGKSREESDSGSQERIDEPKVSYKFWQFLSDLQIPITHEAQSNRNNLEATYRTEKPAYGKARQSGRWAESSIEGLNVQSEKRTGYQTSE